jgi:hypothetical protein
LALALALFCATLAARAALQFDVFVGYDDLVPERSWFPITCELNNDGPSFNAVIELATEDFGPGQTRRLALDLPANTRKRLFIPVFASAGTWQVRLLDERGVVRAEQTLQTARVVRSGLPLVAALARTVAGTPVFPELPSVLASEPKYTAARLQPALFPDNPLALDGIDLLYLSSERAANLSLGQVNALMAWLQDGGHLVLGVEQLTDVNATPWLREVLPCQLSTTVSLNEHDALQNWSVRPSAPTPTPAPILGRRGQVRPSPPRSSLGPSQRPRPLDGGPLRQSQPASGVESAPSASVPDAAAEDNALFAAAPLPVAVGSLRDGKVLIGSEAAPLAMEANRGRGKITVLTFSPEREPFVSWKGRGWFWARLAGIPGSAFQQGRQQNWSFPGRLSSDGIFGAMIDSKQVRKLPLGWLLALLLAYLAVIGPLDQYWLRKINRPMLTWITFPCYVLLFSGLIYFIGFYLRAGQLEWNELNLVDILPANERAVLRGQTYLSIYSPNNAHYQLAGRQRFASFRGESLGHVGGAQESSRAVVRQTGDNFEADAFVPVWTSQLFVSDWVEAAPAPLEMTVSHQGSQWQVTVENHLDHLLPQVRVVLGGAIFDLGAVGGGETKSFSLEAGRGLPLGDLARQWGEAFRNAVQARHSSFGENANTLPDVAAGAMAASFLSGVNVNNNNNSGWNNFTAPSNLDLSRFADDSHAILLAWDGGHSLTEALNRFQPKRLHRDSLLRLVIPID